MRTLQAMSVRVGVREFRENLRAWLDRAEAGEEVIVTERGIAKVKVTAPHAENVLDRLIREGKVDSAEPATPVSGPGRGGRYEPRHRLVARRSSREGLLILYFDASAVVKLLIVEHGSNEARRLWNDDAPVVTSWITFAEVSARNRSGAPCSADLRSQRNRCATPVSRPSGQRCIQSIRRRSRGDMPGTSRLGTDCGAWTRFISPPRCWSAWRVRRW